VTKISEMTAAGPLTGAELVPVVQNGVNVRATAASFAALSPFRGARLRKVSNQSVPANAYVRVLWGSALERNDGFWSAGAPHSFRVPAGVTKIRMTVGVLFVESGYHHVEFRKNGASIGGDSRVHVGFAYTIPSMVIDVLEGDVFEVWQWSGIASTVLAAEQAFWEIEVVESAYVVGVPPVGSVGMSALDADVRARLLQETKRGARIRGVANDFGFSTNTWINVPFAASDYDTEGLYQGGTGHGFIIPANKGITQARFRWLVSTPYANLNYTELRKNGAWADFAGATNCPKAETNWFETVPGDIWTFHLLAQTSSFVRPTRSWAEIEVR